MGRIAVESDELRGAAVVAAQVASGLVGMGGRVGAALSGDGAPGASAAALSRCATQIGSGLATLGDHVGSVSTCAHVAADLYDRTDETVMPAR